MKDRLKKPCKSCPWKRTSSPGWLGASTAEEFVLERGAAQDPMECHMSVDYDDPDWLAKIETPDSNVAYCLGAAQFLANWMSMPRDREWGAVVARMRREAPEGHSPYLPYPEVFSTPQEALAHHDNERNRGYVEAAERIGRRA